MVLYYAMRNLLPLMIKGKDYKRTYQYKSLQLFRKTLRSSPKECKPLIKIYLESNRLSKFYKCFPETYFQYGMFLRGFGDYELMKSYLPKQAYSRYAKDADPRYHILIDDKILFHDIMRMYSIPVPERYFVFRDKSFRKDGRIITDEEADRIIAGMTGERVYIKKHRGGGGKGVSIALRGLDGYYTEDNKKLTSALIREKCGSDCYIFEKQLVQDSVLAKLNPDTINTCRVLTYKGEVISCAIRVGRKGSYVDNASQGGIVLNLNMETGRLEEYGLGLFDLTKYYEHPDTGIKFKDYEVPMWPEVKLLVEKITKVLPYYNSVGFDVATTVDGPVIIEINTGAGICGNQMGAPKGIADKFIK